ncbi:hypothetical protein PWG71_18045 [Nocardiopsis sp. N85]|uniref:hypothetical protein n=1 Tax=Nocardiopsis sp. N85 TaxID=3029400 RepID=UPI00237F9624|nr:hypothetical protein [Nocardiopsis sp. N85]MDE3723298.1 hypothetical protein [Nocardiopsis sp. N85]
MAEDTGWAGGFDCVLGNPPWDQVQVDAREFFASRRPDIAEAANMTSRNSMIGKLENEDPELLWAYNEEKRGNDGFKHFAHASGRFPLTSYGRLNTYSLFAEAVRWLVSESGRTAQIIPSGIATDSFNQYFFKDLVQKGSIAALYDFENSSPLFPSVHRSFKFCILSLVGRGLRESKAWFAFFLYDPAELDGADKAFIMTPEEITLLNPNTGTCPVFRSRRDAEITLDIYRRVPILVKEGDPNGNPWGVSFQLMFMMNTDSDKFHTRRQLENDGWNLEGNVFVRDGKRMLPLYEAKMLHHYDHRWATYTEGGGTRDLTLEEKQDPNAVVMPRYWVGEVEVSDARKNRSWDQSWFMGFRKICRSTDERTIVSFVFPEGGIGDSGNVIISEKANSHLLYAVTVSFALDYFLRQKLGGTNLNFFQFMQLPVLKEGALKGVSGFISRRVLEMVFTSTSMGSFNRVLGDSGGPFRWDEGRRAAIRAELDALFFHLYGIDRDDADYIMETFPIVKKKDVAKYGAYRTKERILEIYDRMAEAGVSQGTPLVDGENFISELTPPPGHGPRHAPAS